MKDLIILYSPLSAAYSFVAHPESPERVLKSYKFLKGKGFKFEGFNYVDENEVLLVHTKAHLEAVKTGSYFNLDTPWSKDIFKYALLAVGGAKGVLS